MVSYIISTISSKAVPDGFTKNPKGKGYIIDRAHNGSLRANQYSKLILLLRNYKDCIVRHHGLDHIHKYPSLKRFLIDKKQNQPPVWYASNIMEFHKFTGDKIILYYEDLMTNPEDSILKLSSFLDLEIDVAKEFIKDIDKHYLTSVNRYIEKGHESFTNKLNQAIGVHESKLETHEKIAFDLFFEDICGTEVYNQYLIRYRDENS